MTARVIYQDESLVVVCKPPGLPTQADSRGGRSLLDEVGEWWGRPVHPVHRLDTPVGGLVVVAPAEVATALSRQFQARTVEKGYLAVVRGRPESGLLVHYLSHDARRNRSRAYAQAGPGRKRAETELECLQSREDLSLVRLRPRTGRHHQLRVQLAALGCPISGDVRYGAKRPMRSGAIGLFAYRLGFEHPVQNQRLDLRVAPEGQPWSHWPEVAEVVKEG